MHLMLALQSRFSAGGHHGEPDHPKTRRRHQGLFAASLAPQRASAAGQAHVTLIIGGGIAAYKALDLIRRLKERNIQIRCVLTKAAQQFVTPLAASALSNERC